jgi:hypothetical protein
MRTFLLVAMLVVLPVQAQAQAQAGYMTGNQLVGHMHESEGLAVGRQGALPYSAGTYNGYVTAAADAYAEAGVICLPANASLGQTWAVVSAYLKAHPADWHQSAISLVGRALEEAFPCG